MIIDEFHKTNKNNKYKIDEVHKVFCTIAFRW